MKKLWILSALLGFGCMGAAHAQIPTDCRVNLTIDGQQWSWDSQDLQGMFNNVSQEDLDELVQNAALLMQLLQGYAQSNPQWAPYQLYQNVQDPSDYQDSQVYRQPQLYQPTPQVYQPAEQPPQYRPEPRAYQTSSPGQVPARGGPPDDTREYPNRGFGND